MGADLLILVGPPSVGKMTVGQEISRKNGFRLFHNHLTIECVLPVFPYDHPSFKKLVNQMRNMVMEEFAQRREGGLIFTFVLTRGYEAGIAALADWANLFSRHGGKVWVVELEAPLAVRLVRNRSENRLLHKLSKRDIAQSEAIILKSEAEHRYDLRSREGLQGQWAYFKLDVANLSPVDAANEIIKYMQT